MAAIQQESPYLLKDLQDFSYISVLCEKLRLVKKKLWIFFFAIPVMSSVLVLSFLPYITRGKYYLNIWNSGSVPSGYTKIYMWTTHF